MEIVFVLVPSQTLPIMLALCLICLYVCSVYIYIYIYIYIYALYIQFGLWLLLQNAYSHVITTNFEFFLINYILVLKLDSLGICQLFNVCPW